MSDAGRRILVGRCDRVDGDATAAGILGVQLALVGLFLAAFFENVSVSPLVGLRLAVTGTAVVLTALFRA